MAFQSGIPQSCGSLPAHPRNRSLQARTSKAGNSNRPTARPRPGKAAGPVPPGPRRGVDQNSLQRKPTHGPSLRFAAGAGGELPGLPVYREPGPGRPGPEPRTAVTNTKYLPEPHPMGHRCGPAPPGNRIGGTSLRPAGRYGPFVQQAPGEMTPAPHSMIKLSRVALCGNDIPGPSMSLPGRREQRRRPTVAAVPGQLSLMPGMLETGAGLGRGRAWSGLWSAKMTRPDQG